MDCVVVGISEPGYVLVPVALILACLAAKHRHNGKVVPLGLAISLGMVSNAVLIENPNYEADRAEELRSELGPVVRKYRGRRSII